MKKMLMCCALLASASFAHAYDLVATASLVEESKWHFDIQLANNDIDFTAFQLDIALDGDAKLERKDMKTGPLMRLHSLMLVTPQDLYRVAGYNLSCVPFKEKEGTLFSFTLDGDIKGIVIKDFFFVMPDGTKVEADIAEGVDVAEETDVVDAGEVAYELKDKQSYRIDRRGISLQK